MAIDLARYQNVVVLTGAGVSAASGLPTYRGAGGLWEKDEVAALGTLEAWVSKPNEVWKLFGGLRSQVVAAAPNAAHASLARMESVAPGKFTLVTQNVDGLHQQAGSQNVVELHGNLRRTRCHQRGCQLEAFHDEVAHQVAPLCTECGDLLRPDIVLFGEQIPAGPDHLATRALRDCDLFIAVGTSGMVSPASRFVRSAEYVGARTVLINLEALKEGGAAFHDKFVGPAGTLLSEIFLEDG